MICISKDTCTLRDLVSFVQFLNLHTFSNNPTWVFFMFFKLYKWYQIAKSISHSKTCSTSCANTHHDVTTFAGNEYLKKVMTFP